MDLNTLLEALGDKTTVTLAGLLIGTGFGICAQRSRFCLRSAVIEFWNRHGSGRQSVWLFAFAAAIITTQLAVSLGWLDVSQARQLASTGSLSGAVLGGLLFGIGMVLARGCSSRMLVLAANGNLRALLTGLIFAVTAQASLHGLLSPLRTWLSGLWTIDGGNARDLLASSHLGHTGGIVFGLFWLAAALHFARRSRLQHREWLGGLGVGLMIALAWLTTFQIGTQSFEIVPVQSLSFTGPSADVLMLVLSAPGQPWDFDIGLVPGVVLGSFLAALWGKELKLEGFKDGHSMRRYIFGAVCMGFGGMLAGGCAVGAGVSGAAIFALTAWLSLIAMWLGAGVTNHLLDRPAHHGASKANFTTHEEQAAPQP